MESKTLGLLVAVVAAILLLFIILYATAKVRLEQEAAINETERILGGLSWAGRLYLQ